MMLLIAATNKLSIFIDFNATNYDKSGKVNSKTSVGFLENLNAKLAEQRLSANSKAFAVRTFINSKALVSFFSSNS